MICAFGKTGRRDSLLYLRGDHHVQAIASLLSRRVRDRDPGRISKFQKSENEIGTATTIRLVTGLLLANRETITCFFQRHDLFDERTAGGSWGETLGGYSRLRAPGALMRRAPGATLYKPRLAILLRIGFLRTYEKS